MTTREAPVAASREDRRLAVTPRVDWVGSTRRSRLPPNWRKLRLRVMRRDQNACQWVVNLRTGETHDAPATEVDHIVPGDDHSMSNLQALCSKHHAQKSGTEGARAAANGRAIRKAQLEKRAEVHPGLIRPPRDAGESSGEVVDAGDESDESDGRRHGGAGAGGGRSPAPPTNGRTRG